MNESRKNRIGDFLAGKGFYIVLFLCVAAIGISGYYLLHTLNDPGESQTVAGPMEITVTPTQPEHSAPPSIEPVRPTQPAAAVVRPSAAPTPSPTPAPEEVQAPTAEFYVWPLQGEVLHPYSMEALAYDPTMGDWRTHDGLDLSAPAGTQVMSAGDGTVLSVVQDDLMGTSVSVDHGNGMVSVYANLAAVPAVEAGDTVRAGDVIGTVGDTAIAESGLGPHLHFAMRLEGESVDPAEYLP